MTNTPTPDGDKCSPAYVRYVDGHQALNGVVPFQGELIDEMLRRVLHDKPNGYRDTPGYAAVQGKWAEINRDQRLYNALQTWRKTGTVHPCVAQYAFDIWKKLLSISEDKRLPVPDAAEGNNGEVLLLWEKDEHYMEIEVSSFDQYSVFYKNEATNNHWYAEGNCADFSAESMREIVQYFV